MTRGKSEKPKVRVLSSRTVYKGPVFSVVREEVAEPGNVRATREIVRHTGSVVILAVDESRGEPRVLLVRQYRHAARQYLWELPAGRHDKDEPELAGAKRELLEETGYSATNWKRILNFYASPGFLAETMSIFWARELKGGKAQPEEDERITKRMFPLSAALKLVFTGTIRDAKTISGLLWMSHHLCHEKPQQQRISRR